MSGISGWLGGGAAIIVIGLCWVLMHHGDKLPAMTHPWLHRAVIVLMYSAGAVLVFTTAGGWILHALNWAGGFLGGTAPGSGIGWALVTIGALLLFAGLVVALIWEPDPGVAYVAAATPLVLALAPGGFVHHVFTITTAPAQALVEQLGHAVGG